MSIITADVVVIGAGIAGASAAAGLAESLKVIVLEREVHPAMHSTGRSAALFSEIYGGAAVRALSRASRDFLYSPPDGFIDGSIVTPRGALHIASAAQIAQLDAFCALPDVSPAVRRLSAEETCAACPILKPEHIVAGVVETASADVDVDLLHQGWLRQFRERGGDLRLGAEVGELSRLGDGWRIRTESETYNAPVVVDAAGAWADVVATMAGVRPIGLMPRRRTALVVPAPEGQNVDAWPMVFDIDEQFYFRPEAGGLLLSPGDETPSDPCDAQPDEWDIAVAIDRVEAVTTLRVRRVKRSWAGLRSFVADRTPVVGFAPEDDGFFWLAGQGGYGIQTAPAMGALATSLVLGGGVPSLLSEAGVTAEAVSPGRDIFAAQFKQNSSAQ
jgi:D-arginine dehydrogenase